MNDNVIVFFCILSIGAFFRAGGPIYGGIKYHFIDEQSANRTHEGWTKCEYTYDDAKDSKQFLIIFPNEDEAGIRKIGFYCKGLSSSCCGLDCCVPFIYVFLIYLGFVGGIILLCFCFPVILISIFTEERRAQLSKFMARVFCRKSHAPETPSTTATATATETVTATATETATI